MANIFLISDTHFGHEKTCTAFKRADGTPLRPFSCADEMDEFMVQAWNRVVRARDRVYHLGDVVINRRALTTMSRLNGDKVLIRGNHDIFKLGDYTPYFRDVRGCHVLDGLVLTHVPVHPDSLARFGCNVHGHLHANRVMQLDLTTGQPILDPRYFNVSVEHTEWAPISFEDVKRRILEQGGRTGLQPGHNDACA